MPLRQVTHIGDPILAFFAVADEELAVLKVNIMQLQIADFANMQQARVRQETWVSPFLALVAPA
jgi:hypothetical protein